jgi:hypothetical protein
MTKDSSVLSEKTKRRWEQVRHNLLKESDRGAALVGGAMVEEALKGLVLATLRPPEQGKVAKVPSGLRMFSAVLEYCEAMGLITAYEVQDAEQIQAIRNGLAAHVIGPHDGQWSFETPDVRQHLARCVVPRPAADKRALRDVFSQIVIQLAATLWQREETARELARTKGRSAAIGYLLSAVENGTDVYLARFDEDPPSSDGGSNE